MRWTFQLEVLEQGKLRIEKIKADRNANAPNLGLDLSPTRFIHEVAALQKYTSKKDMPFGNGNYCVLK